jgi:hypothetical protein
MAAVDEVAKALNQLMHRLNVGGMVSVMLAVALAVFIWIQATGAKHSVDFQQALLTRVERLEVENDRLQREVSELRIENARVGGMFDSLPFPAWGVWKDGTLRRVNPAYVSEHYIPRNIDATTCIGNRHDVCWPKELAKKFDQADRLVMATRRTVVVCEQVRENPVEYRQFIKFPSYSGTDVVGVDGVEIPMSKCSPGHLPKILPPGQIGAVN